MAAFHCWAHRSWDRSTTAEEILIRGGFLWGAVFDEMLDRLTGSSVLVLAGQSYLAPATCEGIKAFAAAGGGVAILGEAAVWDEDGMLYEPSPLADLKGRRVIRMAGDTLENGRRASRAVSISLPKQWRSVADALQQASDRRLTARLHGSTCVAMSACRTTDDRLALHLVNYAAPKSAGPLRVELGDAWSGRSSARLVTPEDGERPLPRIAKAAQPSIEIPSIDVYGIVVVG